MKEDDKKSNDRPVQLIIPITLGIISIITMIIGIYFGVEDGEDWGWVMFVFGIVSLLISIFLFIFRKNRLKRILKRK